MRQEAIVRKSFASYAAVTVLAGFLVSAPSAAAEKGESDGYAGLTEVPREGVEATARIGYSVPGNSSAPGRAHGTERTTAQGTVHQANAPTTVVVDFVPETCAPIARGGGAGAIYELSNAAPAFCVAPPQIADRERGGRGPAPPSPEALARIAADRAITLAPDPDLRIAPEGVGLTGLDSFFWLDEAPRPIVARASAGGLTVTAEAAPVQYVWTFGDGADLVTDHSGRPWTSTRPGDIEHLYEARGRYEVTVEVVWSARWRAGAGPWTSLGYFSTSDTVDYPVRQVVAVLVPPR